MKNELTESLEKYLLAIYEIVKVNQAARVRDVSNYLKIGGPATSDAIKTLAQRKFINYVPYGIITITEKGITRAEEKLSRYKIISKFLDKVLHVEGYKIEECTKKMEYTLPDEVLERFVQYLSFTDNCSCKESKWTRGFNYYIENEEMPTSCKLCMENKDNFDNSSCCSNCIK